MGQGEQASLMGSLLGLQSVCMLLLSSWGGVLFHINRCISFLSLLTHDLSQPFRQQPGDTSHWAGMLQESKWVSSLLFCFKTDGRLREGF